MTSHCCCDSRCLQEDGCKRSRPCDADSLQACDVLHSWYKGKITVYKSLVVLGTTAARSHARSDLALNLVLLDCLLVREDDKRSGRR